MPYKDQEQRDAYQREYRHNKPRSLNGVYYPFYLLIATLPEDDLRVLFTIKKQRLRHCHNEDCRLLRTHLSMIRDMYRTRRQDDLDEPQQPIGRIIDFYTDQDQW